jgi:peptide/nickel transport system ATP-binding protein
MIASSASGSAVTSALSVHGLTVRLTTGEAIVEDLDLALAPGEILGLVGESGSGKTTTALALMGYSAPGVEIAAGALRLGGKETAMDESMRAMRGAVISYVPQEPGRSLNPSLRLEAGIQDIARAHRGREQPIGAIQAIMESVGLPTSPTFLRRFPHQLSGGQQQRVCIGSALVCDANVLVLDEPTTGLDVVTQAHILRGLARLRDESGVAMLYVTHDLAVVAQIADRVAVMYAGRIVETGPTRAVLTTPHHPYTRGLVASSPDHVQPAVLEPLPGVAAGVGERRAGCAFAPRCQQRAQRCETLPTLEKTSPERDVRCFFWRDTPVVRRVTLRPTERSEAQQRPPLLEVEGLSTWYRARGSRTRVTSDIDVTVQSGASVAIVGESGSGKTTIARAIAGLHTSAHGTLRFDGEPLRFSVRRRTMAQRRRLQLVAQNPADALNPRQTVYDTIARPARFLRGVPRGALAEEVRGLLDRVRLPAGLASRYPAELSGGERQRVALARALAAGPDLLLCDEVTSALDVSVQAAILELLVELREALGLSLVFISHDLGVVSVIADEVLVLEKGSVCERGTPAGILRRPRQPYTRRLLAAAPSIAGQIRPQSEGSGAG